MAGRRDLYADYSPQPPAPIRGLKTLEQEGWTEVPLIADSPDEGLPRKVYGRISSTGNLELGIESTAAIEALRKQARGSTAPASLPAGTTTAERAAFYREHAPRVRVGGVERAGTGSPGGMLPEELAPNVREERLRILQRQRYGMPLIQAQTFPSELPLNVPGRTVPRATSPERHAFATALIPATALHALDEYLGKAVRSDQQTVVAAGWALFTARISSKPMGYYGGAGSQVSVRAAYRGATAGESFVPGSFPPGYVVAPRTSAPLVPVTTDTVAALEYFVRNKLRGGGTRGRGVYRSLSPPRRNRISNYLTAAGWRTSSRTPGFNVAIYEPPAGPPPKD